MYVSDAAAAADVDGGDDDDQHQYGHTVTDEVRRLYLGRMCAILLCIREMLMTATMYRSPSHFEGSRTRSIACRLRFTVSRAP